MRDVLAGAASFHLAFPTKPEDQIVLALTWAPTAIVALILCVALLILVARRPPPGDDEDGQAPGWFRLLRAAMFAALMQALMAGIIVLIQTDAFTSLDPTNQYTPRGIVLGAALIGLLAFFPDPHNSARVLARGRARLVGPFQTPVIGLLAPAEERICTAYGRITGAFWLMVAPPIVAGVGLSLLARVRQIDLLPLIVPFLLCWGAALLAFWVVVVSMRQLNRRSLTAYCQELVTLARKWVDAVDAELRLEGLGLYQRVADLADALGKDRLLQEGRMQTAEAVAEARLALAQASLEPGGQGLQEATAYLIGAVELRDLKPGEWLGLGWLLASDYVPTSLLQDRARYGHLLLSYCRAWVTAQQQLRQKTPLSAAVRTNVRLGMVVTMLERRVCALSPSPGGQQAQSGEAGKAAKDAQAPWRADTFLPELAARPDLRLLLALNEAMLQLDATLPWARVNAGLCRLALGDAAAARAHLEVAASQRRDDPSLPFYRAVAYAREQQSGEALALLEELTEKELGWFLAVRTYAETLLEVFKAPQVSTTTGTPVQSINAERWKRALSILERALMQESIQARLQTPGAAPIYLAAGMAELFGRQQPAQADLWFRRALGLDRQNVQAWYGLALASWEQAKTDATLSAAQEALRYQPDHVPAMTLCAHLLMVRGEMVQAGALADQALRLLSDANIAQLRVVHHPRLFPERDVLLRVKGRAAFEQGHFDEAFAALDQVVRRYVDARFFAACALYHLGRYARATERLKDYLASKEGARDGRAFLYLGCALHAQGKEHQRAALNALDTCLTLTKPDAPERLRGLLERGQIHEEREEFEAAEQDYQAALEIERSALPIYVLAALYHRIGRDEDAYALLEPLINRQARAGAAGQSISGQAGSSQPGTAQVAAQGHSSNTIVFAPSNQPMEAEIQRLYEILRERLAEQARQALAASRAAQEEQPPSTSADEEKTSIGQPEPAVPAEDAITPEETDRTSPALTQPTLTGAVPVEDEKTVVSGSAQPETPTLASDQEARAE